MEEAPKGRQINRFCRPFGAWRSGIVDPGLTPWATIFSPLRGYSLENEIDTGSFSRNVMLKVRIERTVLGSQFP